MTYQIIFRQLDNNQVYHSPNSHIYLPYHEMKQINVSTASAKWFASHALLSLGRFVPLSVALCARAQFQLTLLLANARAERTTQTDRDTAMVGLI